MFFKIFLYLLIFLQLIFEILCFLKTFLYLLIIL